MERKFIKPSQNFTIHLLEIEGINDKIKGCCEDDIISKERWDGIWEQYVYFLEQDLKK